MKSLCVISFTTLMLISLGGNLLQAQPVFWQRISTLDSIESNWIYELSATSIVLKAKVILPGRFVPSALSSRFRSYISTNKGGTWMEMRWQNDTLTTLYSNTGYLYGLISVANSNSLFATLLLSNLLCISPDTGKTWSVVKPQKTNQWFTSGAEARSEKAVSMGQKLLILYYNTLSHSFDAGKTIIDNYNGQDLEHYPIYIFTIEKTRDIVWAASSNGLFSTSDTGGTWVKRSILPEKIRGGVFPVTPSVVFYRNLIDSLPLPNYYRNYISRDSGQSWAEFTFRTPKETIKEVLAVSAKIYAGTKEGLFSTADEGRTWDKESGNKGLPEGEVGALALSSNTLFVSVLDRGLFIFDTTPVGVHRQSASTVFLSTPAPNPTADFTDISFTLAHATQTRLSLYSTLGTEVWHSEHGMLPAGEQRLRISTRGLPPGVYVYRLTAGGVSSVGRIVVVR